MNQELEPLRIRAKNYIDNQLSILRQEACNQIENSLRPGQQQMAQWLGGEMAVSAVPGAGKSTGMAAAAAVAIARYGLHSRYQLIVVTFTRSAAANIKAKIRYYLQKKLSLPPTGFSVHTLHGLALNIASRHPDLSGLQLDNSTLITPNQSHRLIRTCVEQWIANYPGRYSKLLQGRQFDGEETERLRRQSVLRTEVLPGLAHSVIREAKSSGILPATLSQISSQSDDEYDILAIASGLYEQYQSIMRSRDLIDYDDMILGALRVLDNDRACQIEQNQVFAVFEDEAQDSSQLQTKLLKILAVNDDFSTNLIRVGDPNQAINSTFTPADPIYFRQFCEQCDRQGHLATMDRAGRSSKIIIDAANFTLEWVNRTYKTSKAPFRVQKIHPVDADDPQSDANPAPGGKGLELYTPRDIHHTASLIGDRVISLLTEHSNRSCAILVRENKQGQWLAEKLAPVCQEHDITLYEVSESDRRSHVPAEILAWLQFLDRPHSPDYLKAALAVLVQRQLIERQDLNALALLPEQFIYPTPLDPPLREAAIKPRNLCHQLLRARLELPPYQLISFLALTLSYDGAELATADKLAERVAQQTAGNSSLAAMLTVLNEIVSSERFEPVETDALEERFTRPGQLTIISMHKAKGLDWDYVFLPFLHENIIPGILWVPPQTHFLGEFSLSEVARAQIRAHLHGQAVLPDITQAWEDAKQLKTAEEFRLLYVAMTRAKRLLWMSAAQKAPFIWSKPNSLDNRAPCPVFPALKRQFPSSAIAPDPVRAKN